MKIIPAIITAAVTLSLTYAFSNKLGNIPPLGNLLSPQTGFWRNAEPIGQRPHEEVVLPGLSGKASVWFDDRAVPHIFADNDADAYYVQGFVTARDRLWQMELQTMAAAGRLSEILGPNLIRYDRSQRRLGMLYGAELAVKTMMSDPDTKTAVTAYAAGINAYIATLTPATLPVEYKILDYKPEKWDIIKSALLLKYMAHDLAGFANDLEYTNARRLFSLEDFNLMYPDFQDTLDPIIPKGTAFAAATAKATAPPDSLLAVDEAILKFKMDKPNPENGSNNWAVSGNKTRSGAPILCSDPHLGLSLPSIWYEVQIHTPDMNVYGASLPGSPGVIIGFNDQVAWGVTNGEVDVKDYYRMQFRNGKQEYLFNGNYRPADLRIEEIKVRGGQTVKDTVAYTVWGPVIYDNTFPDKTTKESFLAMRWKALDPSNELGTFRRLNKARNYEDYLEALKFYTCPAQNFVFAAKSGDIAIWQNGIFPVRWRDQGKWIMPGSDSTYAWQGYIPREELPHIKNPERGFVSSANQRATDNTYPYPLYGQFDLFRGERINQRLAVMNGITPQDMMALQNDNKNLFAAAAIPLFRRHLDTTSLDATQRSYWQLLSSWDCVSNADSKAASVFNYMWNSLEDTIWHDELRPKDTTILTYPQSTTTLLLLLRDTSFHFLDNINTPQKETLSQLIQGAFIATAKKAAAWEKAGTLELGKVRGTDINHLSRALPAFSALHLFTGGGRHIVNASQKTHGPSWRMVVQLSDKTEAYGIYPGGQSGNPGSPYYDNSVGDWAAGKYYLLHIFSGQEKDDAAIRYKMTFAGK
ncbi:penicillin acylase family protein [Chitinophaga nivalis]|uniref:Penicillin acylase family protein n=1 Tax=Chitinophaga nivalis TaxID=2991709 RepID=A0ABT3IPW6_9BACT|nr:penicillin acylase family protein [Chitinophaga nivalis]MCW3464464.1 penicillin acylase family protein [Chitinophaga nivalis]MCW3485845.1 penicillin acylase family protein [Chitinophaga nivalis]